MSLPLAVTLAELRSPLEKSYRNTAYCAGTLEEVDGMLRGHYCGNRWCLVCSRVRAARAINRYLPIIAAWPQPYLLTLTLPNVRAKQLAGAIADMLRNIVAIGRAIRRTDRLRLCALRKLECTYSPDRDDYHPHFHLAIDGREQAEAIRRRWLEHHPQASPSAQDLRPCDRYSLIELFKYFTKILTKRPMHTHSRSVAPAVALDVIFTAMKGRRVFQPMGFTVAANPSQDETAQVGIAVANVAPRRCYEPHAWVWLQAHHDWIDSASGEVLTGYQPSRVFLDLVKTLAPTNARLARLAARDPTTAQPALESR